MRTPIVVIRESGLTITELELELELELDRTVLVQQPIGLCGVADQESMKKPIFLTRISSRTAWTSSETDIVIKTLLYQPITAVTGMSNTHK